MPFNGAGAYSLPAGSIVADGTTIDAADHNTPLQDIESSLSTVTLRNGATPFTGNQSFGNNKITSLAAGTVATDGATLAQAQSQVSNRATAIGGTANAVTLTFSPPFAAYTNGMRIRWRATATNTAAMTINVDGLGAKNFQMDASGTLAATFSGAVVSGMTIEAEYNSAADVFVWLNQKPVFINGSGLVGVNAQAIAGAALNVGGAIRSSGDFGEFRTATASNRSWRLGTTSTGATLGRCFIQGSTDNFSTSFIDGLSVDDDGNVTIRSTDTDPALNGVAQAIALRADGRISARGTDNFPTVALSRGGTDGSIINFYKATTVVGSVSVSAAATAYNTTSDYRLKENVLPLHGALSKVAQLKPCSYTWKVDGSAGEGFIAHELQDVIPLAVTGEKDAVSDDGSPDYQAVDLSKVVPVLVAAIQELAAEVADLKARVNAA